MQIAEIKEKCQKLFNEKIIGTVKYEIYELKNEEERQEKKAQSIKDYDYDIEPKLIERIIKNLPNNRDKGFAEVLNELFKYGASQELLMNF